MTRAIGLMLFALTSCDRPLARDPVQKMVRGEVLEMAANSLTVRPFGASARENPPRLVVGTDARTTVSTDGTMLNELKGELTSIPTPMHLTDLHTADHVLISTRDGVAVSIKLMPATMRGTLVRTDGKSITLKREKPPAGTAAEQTFAIEPGKTTVVARRIDNAAFERHKLTDFQPGELVSITSRNGIAQLVSLVPPDPVQGHVKAVDATSVTLAPTTRPGETAMGDQRFALDSTRTIFFEMYLGMPTERVSLQDIRADQAVTVVAKNGVAQSVTIVHSPIHRRLISMDGDSMTVNRNPQTPNEQFLLVPTTRVLVARVTNTFKSPSGKNGYGYTYVDAKQADLKPGDDLSITAKGAVALEIRRAFRADQMKAGQ